MNLSASCKHPGIRLIAFILIFIIAAPLFSNAAYASEISDEYAQDLLASFSEDAFDCAVLLTFDDGNILEYDSPEAAKEAFVQLTKRGIDVLPDLPATVGSADWGYDYMNMSFMNSVITDISDFSSGSVTVAVIDSGINEDHSVFKEHTILQGYDFTEEDTDPDDQFGHGTAVAGIIAANTPSNVKLLPCRVLDETGEKNMSLVCQAVEWAADNGADFISLSTTVDLSLRTTNTELMQKYVDLYDKSFKYARDKGVIIIVNAGNNLTYGGVNVDNNMVYPSCSTYTMCVTAIDESEGSSWFANYGSSVDFSAPGSNIRVADFENTNGYYTDNGTSFAQPYVTAAAAMLVLSGVSKTQDAVYAALKSICRDLGTTGKDSLFGWGCPDFSNFADINIRTSLTSNSLPVSVSTYEIPVTETQQFYLYSRDIELTSDIVWKSSRTSVISVDSNGLITPKKAGKAAITASYNGLSASVTIQVLFSDVLRSNVSNGIFTSVYSLTEKNIISGYGGIEFRPDNNISRMSFCMILWKMAGRPEADIDNEAENVLKFADTSDLSGNHLKALIWAVKKGVIRGYSDGTFRPDDNIKRSEMAIMLYRYAGRPKVDISESTAQAEAVNTSEGTASDDIEDVLTRTPSTIFSDVYVEDSTYKPILWCYAAGIIRGYADGTFCPGDYSTRGQTAIMIYRFLKLQ